MKYPTVGRNFDRDNYRMRDQSLSDGTLTLSPLRVDDAVSHLAGEDKLAGPLIIGRAHVPPR